MQALSRFAPSLLSLLRIAAGLLILLHGARAVLGFPRGGPPQPALLTQAGLQGLVELGGGAALALGLFTRPVALVLLIDMAATYALAHARRSPHPLLNGGEAAMLFCFVLLYLAAAGAGPLSVDRMRGRA